MEYRRLGASGLFVPVLTLGTGTFGGKTDFFKPWGALEVRDATRLVDICLDAGLNMFDTADVYSNGQAEEILGAAIGGRRDSVLISTKATFRRCRTERRRIVALHLIRAVDAACAAWGPTISTSFSSTGSMRSRRSRDSARARRSGPSGKIRYIGASNFSGWHLMKSLAVSDRYGLSRYVAHQAYYSLIGREYEWDSCRWPRSEGRRRRLESARLGPAYRQDSPGAAAARGIAPAGQDHCRDRAAGRHEYLYASST